MRPIAINWAICFMNQCVALLLFGYLLAGCAASGDPSSESPGPDDTGAAMTQAAHAIIYFQDPVSETTANNTSLSAAISDACRCSPVFLRTIGTHGLIYSITLPQGQDFSVFENTLMRNAPRLGIETVEQDGMKQGD